MRWLRFAVLIIAFTIIQASFIVKFAISSLDITPNLLIIALVFFAIYSQTRDAIITSFIIGFAADLTGPMMGPQTIAFGILGASIAYLNRVIAVRKMPYQGLVIIIISFLALLAAYALGILRNQPKHENILELIAWTSLYSGIIGPFLFLPCRWWMHIKPNRFSKK